MNENYFEITTLTKSFTGAYRIVDYSGIVRYVGSSKNVKKRIQDHISMLLRNNHECRALQDFYNQNGKLPFKYFIKKANDREHAFDLEQEDLDRWFNNGYLFNVGKNVRNPRIGLKISEEHKEAISKANKGKVVSPETIAKIQKAKGNYRHTEETKQKLSISHKGKKQSEEHKQKKADSNRGKKRSEETRARQSKAQQGKTHNIETRRKLSQINKGNKNALGYKHTVEARLKMSLANKGKTVKHSDETKRKISETNKGRIISNLSRLKFRQTMEEKRNNGYIDSKSIAVSIDGVIYANLRKANEATSIPKRTIHSRCLSKNFTNYFQIK